MAAASASLDPAHLLCRGELPSVAPSLLLWLVVDSDALQKAAPRPRRSGGLVRVRVGNHGAGPPMAGLGRERYRPAVGGHEHWRRRIRMSHGLPARRSERG
jgi:hypothetical protein